MQVTVTTLSLGSAVALLSFIFIITVCVFTWIFKVEKKLTSLCLELKFIKDNIAELKKFYEGHME